MGTWYLVLRKQAFWAHYYRHFWEPLLWNTGDWGFKKTKHLYRC